MKRLAVIPARSGSKRIPNKNIKDFCGKPMMSYSIEAAAQSEVFNTIHVSTDDDAISKVAQEMGHKPDFSRPDDLSGDHTPMLDVMRYVVNEYEQKGTFFDTIFLLYATSPLTDPSDIEKACAEFEASDKEKAFLAITPYPAPIEHAFRLDDTTKNIQPNDADALSMRTQDLEHAYFDAGMFAIYSAEYIKNSHKAGDFNGFRGYVVPPYRVTDIDWPEDWERAEALYNSVNKKN